MNLAYSTINWGEMAALEPMFAAIGQAGWSAVELFGHSLNWLGTPDTLIKRLGGLRVATLFGSFDLPVTDIQIELHQRRIDYARAIGADAYGLVGGGRLRGRAPTVEEYAQLADFCEGLSHYGNPREIVVAYHPHVGTTVESSPEIRQLLGRTEALRLCLDISHVALVGEDPLQAMAEFWDRIGYFHLKDWARGRFVELGQGSLGIDFGRMLQGIDQRGFDGWVVVEQSRSEQSPEQSARDNAAYVRGLGYALG